MTQNHDHDHQHHQQQHHHHHHHYHNHQESIHAPNKITDTADPKSMEQVKPEFTDPVEPNCTIQIDNKSTEQVIPKCTIQIDNKSSDQINTSPPCVKGPDTVEMIWMSGFLSLLIIAILLVSNFRALKIMVIIGHSFFGILFLATYLYFEYWFDYNDSSASIYPKDRNKKPNNKENEIRLFFAWTSIMVIIDALLIKDLLHLQVLSAIHPIFFLFVCLVSIFVPDKEIE